MKKKDIKILLVDDEPDVIEIIRYNLQQEGYNVKTASNGKEALQKARKNIPHLIIMDVMMPEMDGIEACEQLRMDAIYNDTIIMFLTARGEDYSYVAAFDAGADDYVTKPFAPRELIARIKALLRRTEAGDQRGRLEVEQLVLDVDSRRIFVANGPIEMGPTEFNLLLFFMSHPERAYTRNQLLDHVWGANVYVEERTVDVHIRRLRKALEGGIVDYSDLVQTVRGTGYRFSAKGMVAE